MTDAGPNTLPSVFFLDQSGDLGGAELSLLDIVADYQGEKHLCLLDEGPFAERLRTAGETVEVLPLSSEVRRGSGLGAMISGLPQLMRTTSAIGRSARRFDVVYANTMKALVLAALSRPLHRRPVIWHIRDILSPEHFSGMSLRVARWAANLGTCRQIANSEATAAAFRAIGGKSVPEVIYNAIPDRAFAPDQRAALRAALVAETGFSAERPILGVFGRLADWKGQHVVVEALNAVPEAQLVIVGGALFGEAAYEERLRAQIRDAGLEGRVRLLGFRDDVPALMGGVDVVVHSSIQPEPFGRVIVEAMLAGTPLIATAAGGALEIVKNGETGLLVTPGDAGALTATLADLLEDGAMQTRMASAARANALERFSPEFCFARIAQVLCEARGVGASAQS
ncbi:MAG: glycosyltransferase family 1 protein [Rhodobacteraceae bacterium]|nr:MAG: glycosyltransferase family 1 protein [Paracoccaceae bacterium]